jgi:cyclopropane-fatty-acyl-phospholipid synthase
MTSTTTGRIARQVVAEVFGPPGQRPFTIRYWDGLEEPAVSHRSSFTLVLRHPGVLRMMLLPPSEVAFAKAFLRDDLDLEGDVEAAVAAGRVAAERLASPRRLVRIARLLLHLPAVGRPSTVPLRRSSTPQGQRHSRRRDAAAIQYHYDTGNDFYRLWLGRQMVYSCGYFPPGVSDLDAAQAAKLDYICRKLRLRAGERLLDIGCGWGALIRHAARCYGADALGITLSPAQAEFASRRIAEERLGDRCRVEVGDYRDLPSQPAFDKVASVGMVEHVGWARLPGYFLAAERVLRPGGLFLNHGIVDLETARSRNLRTVVRQRLWREGRFIQRYVFPDGEVVRLAELVRAAEAVGLESRDLESLREHYVLTLRHWRRRLEAREREAVALVGDTSFRVWRLYLAAAAHAFATERLGVVQLLFSKSRAGVAEVPRTRHDLYDDGPRAW